MNTEGKLELIQEMMNLVECWEHWKCSVTAEHVRKICESPRLVGLVAKTIKDPKGLFAEQLVELARCMKTLAENETTLTDLTVCLSEGNETLRSELVAKIRSLSNRHDLS